MLESKEDLTPDEAKQVEEIARVLVEGWGSCMQAAVYKQLWATGMNLDKAHSIKRKYKLTK